MIILEFAGGLGNQMFQYAMYKHLIHLGKDVVCVTKKCDDDNYHFSIELFPGVSFVKANEDLYNKYFNKLLGYGYFNRIVDTLFPHRFCWYVEKEKRIIDNRLFHVDNCVISGYFQGLDYIRPVEDVLRKDFLFPVGEENLQIIKSNLPQNSVAIHIRRGDYLQYPKIFGGICTDQYYKNAINYFLNLGMDKFVVFSNDMEWAKGNLKLDNALYIDSAMFGDYHDWYDMYLMSACENIIIANSTFSWWGAWLNSNPDKIVISPSRFDNLHIHKNLISDNWIVVDS